MFNLDETDAALTALAKSLEGKGLPDGGADYLAGEYGTRAPGLVERASKTDGALERLDAELPSVFAQVDLAVDEEFARTLDDVLSRRIPLVLRARDQGLGVAAKVAARMAAKLGWSPERTDAEVAQYRAVVAGTRAFKTATAS